jgi:hypothetical protein
LSPIYIRPAREQAEHDRLIAFLEGQHKSTFDVLTNRGDARDYALKVGGGTYFPDLILMEDKKPAAVIEIETGESTNNLEALAQWVHFGKAKVPFHLYVPEMMYDAARRFCVQNSVTVTEIWTYRSIFEGFDVVQVFTDPQAVSRSGKGPVAKVVTMPKTVEVPKPEPVAELVEEVVRLRNKSLARKEQAKPVRGGKATVVKTETAAKPAPAPAPPPVAAPKPAKAAKAEKPAKAPKVAKPAQPAKATKAAKPAKPAKAVKAVKAVKAAKVAKATKPAKTAKVTKSAKSTKAAKPTKAVAKAKPKATAKAKPKARTATKPPAKAKARPSIKGKKR